MPPPITEPGIRAEPPSGQPASALREAPDSADAPTRRSRGEDFAINGKFASQRMTGVQRAGYELAAAFARLFPDGARPSLLLPANAADGLQFPGTTTRASRLKGFAWEQLGLPFALGGRTLLSLGNIGPLWTRRQVLMVHDVAVYDLPDNYAWKYRLWYRFAYAILKVRARHVVTVSEFSKQRIMARLRIAASRISVVPNGVDHVGRMACDPRILSRLNLRHDHYVLIVGSLSAGKNLARVLAAIERIRDGHGWQFVVVGGCDLRVFNAKAKSNPALSGRVIAAGFVSDGELKALYEHAGCFLFPSLYEGFGLPPLEAMACGCPVIVSREAALPEVCGDAALYCDAWSVDDIACKLERMMTDPAMRARLRARGRARAAGFSWDRSARRLLEVLERQPG
ncbi:glycosyltransferase family 4 protein [Burkholderia plantarii]|uniref:Mannosyltransferase n=1 Tax=Burkholderia plantarii TaxID=41899 RepID=A0A0B6S9M8_BURPL|nr:mannosyltransferase [Burkholderia plantarii]WLE63926.1 glycosyltransferase family 4 protein [Burkholderia plantarii]